MKLACTITQPRVTINIEVTCAPAIEEEVVKRLHSVGWSCRRIGGISAAGLVTLAASRVGHMNPLMLNSVWLDAMGVLE